VNEATARAVMERLGAFLDLFEPCLSRRVQRRSASRYVEGLLNDSERKSMQAMHGRLADPGSYQGLQHFITHARWASPPFWKRLREVVPVRAGLLLLDETSFPKQGDTRSASPGSTAARWAKWPIAKWRCRARCGRTG
jgi:SRSO17 transposase